MNKKVRVSILPIDKLFIGDINVRKDHSDVDDLVRSIREHGLLNPLIVRENGDGRYEILAGGRRFVACKKIGYRAVRCVILDRDDTRAVEVSIIENLQRKKMTLEEEVEAIRRLEKIYGSLDEVAKVLGLSLKALNEKIDALSIVQKFNIDVEDEVVKGSSPQPSIPRSVMAKISDVEKSGKLGEEEILLLVEKVKGMPKIEALRYINEVVKKPSLLKKKTKRRSGVYLLLDDEDKKLLKEFAKEEGRTMGEYIRNVVHRHVVRKKKRKK